MYVLDGNQQDIWDSCFLSLFFTLSHSGCVWFGTSNLSMYACRYINCNHIIYINVCIFYTCIFLVWKSKGLKVSFWWTCRISTRKRILQLPGNDFGTTLLLALDFLFQLNWVDWSRFYILVCLGTLWLDTIPLHNTRGRCVCSCRVESVKLYFFGIFDFSFPFFVCHYNFLWWWYVCSGS